MVLFSTNLPPKDLVDEAFLRRLRHKIEISDPSYEDYREIFQRVADQKGVFYSDAGLAYLLQEWYIRRNRKQRASHPRDICDQILDIASFKFDTNREQLFISVLTDNSQPLPRNSVYRVILETGNYQEVWMNELGDNSTYGEYKGSALLVQAKGAYLAMTILPCYACESFTPGTTLVLNTSNGLEKILINRKDFR